MNILIIGMGHMGAWFAEELHTDHSIAIFDTDEKKRTHGVHGTIINNLEEIKVFNPQMVINAVDFTHTLDSFYTLFPYLSSDCILADITSVKTGLPDFYALHNKRFVSVHPMFGPISAYVSDLLREHAIIIKESDPEGKKFFKDFFSQKNVGIHEFTFREHDETIAYSLSTPFITSMIFAACMTRQQAPGSTFQKHLETARGLLCEDNHLISEILFNPLTQIQINRMSDQLNVLSDIIARKDIDAMNRLITKIRSKVE
jgi:prephenate dehydrogenase